MTSEHPRPCGKEQTDPASELRELAWGSTANNFALRTATDWLAILRLLPRHLCTVLYVTSAERFVKKVIST